MRRSRGPRKLDLLVWGLEALGATRWIPLRTERSDPRRRVWLDRARPRFEAPAWRGAPEGSQPLSITEPLTLAQALELKAVIWCTSTGELGRPSSPAGTTLLVGPEGGFTADERDQLQQRAVARWCLGPDVLRLEVAALNAVAGLA